MLRARREHVCTTHRDALIEFASQRETGPAVRRALDHLDRCRACESDLATTTLVIHALSRLHEQASWAEPAPDAWPRLRVRLVTRRPAQSHFLSSLVPGAALALVLVIALGNLPALRGTPPVLDDGSGVTLRHASVDDAWRREAGSTDATAARAVAPLTWRAQGLPRPPVLPVGPRPVDTGVLTGGRSAAVQPAAVQPAPLDPASPLDDGAPPAAQMRWR